MSGSQQSADRPALFEELRFAKRQQWYVAASAVTLNAGILALTRGSPLNGIEPLLAVFFILLIAAGSTAVLWDLQDHLLRVRGDLDLYGSSPWHRATDVFYPLTVIIALSAIVMLYLLRFPHLPQCP